MKDIHRCGQKSHGFCLLSSTIQLDYQNNYFHQSGSLTVTLSPDANPDFTHYNTVNILVDPGTALLISLYNIKYISNTVCD